MAIVRRASLEEVVRVNLQIREFEDPYGIDEFRSRLTGVNHLSLVAEEEGTLLGFKVGYEIEPAVFYSWMGGVVEGARGTGVARMLLREQEAWAAAQGYSEIRVKTRNIHRAMVHLLVNHDYLITGVETADDPRHNRIMFARKL